MREVKVCLVGSEKVGKTCLLSMLTGDEFNPIYAPTVGADLHKIVLYDRNLALLFWDLSGHYKYEEIVMNLLKTADAILVCYAADDMGSYREMVEKIMELKRETTSPSPSLSLEYNSKHLFIVCTKKELSRDGELKGMDFAEKNNVNFLSTSAINNLGKKEILLSLANIFAEKRTKNCKKCIVQ
jgi:Ras family protein A